jgi:hypothetical protein
VEVAAPGFARDRAFDRHVLRLAWRTISGRGDRHQGDLFVADLARVDLFNMTSATMVQRTVLFSPCVDGDGATTMRLVCNGRSSVTTFTERRCST